MTLDPQVRTVSDEMSRDVVWLQANDSVLDALVMMEREHVTALPVVDEQERCVGIVSATDLITAARQIVELLSQIAKTEVGSERDKLTSRLVDNGFTTGKVGDLMRTPAKVVAADSTLAKAGRRMLRRRIHHLPVTNDQKELVGIISTMDLMAAFLKAATTNKEEAPTSA
jgi:CBS domain-containing protein